MNKKVWIIIGVVTAIIAGTIFGKIQFDKKQNEQAPEIVDVNEEITPEKINEYINMALEKDIEPERREAIYNKISEHKEMVKDIESLNQIEEIIELEKQRIEKFSYNVNVKIPNRSDDVGIWSNQLQSLDDVTYFSINGVELPLSELQYVNNGLDKVYIHYQNENSPVIEGENTYEFIYKGETYSGTFEFEIVEKEESEYEMVYLVYSNDKEWYHPAKTINCKGECEINCEPVEEYDHEIVAWLCEGKIYQIGEIINIQNDMDIYAVYGE